MARYSGQLPRVQRSTGVWALAQTARIPVSSGIQFLMSTRFHRHRFLPSFAEYTSSSTSSIKQVQTPLQAIAARITAHANRLALAATKMSYSPRSLHPSPDNPAYLLPPDAPWSAHEEQVALRDALAEATLLVTDANELIPELAVRNNQFACLRWLCHFDILRNLPLEVEKNSEEKNPSKLALFSSLSYSVVAKAAGVPTHQLRSIARMAILTGFLSEPVPDQLAHSPLSAEMVKRRMLLDWARFVTSTSAPMVSAMVEATEKWGGDRSLTKTAYAIAWHTDEPLFTHIATDANIQASYVSYMRAMTQSEGMSTKHIIEGWKRGWAEMARRGAVLIDVGGSTGYTSAALARAVPGLKAVV